jgi:hypothetical protein
MTLLIILDFNEEKFRQIVIDTIDKIGFKIIEEL